MDDYYSKRLSAERLRRCYEVAPPRVKQYLGAEIGFIFSRMQLGDRALELGCGYGRVLRELLSKDGMVVGIDTAHDSLQLAREIVPACHLFRMNAAQLGFQKGRFDLVICIQNGISAFKVDQRSLIKEAMRVARPGGLVLFSSYSERFWDARLEWFEVQATHGLIGEIDYKATGSGVIVGKDGFRATTVGPDEFTALASGLGITPTITEVDGSSIFCEIIAP